MNMEHSKDYILPQMREEDWSGERGYAQVHVPQPVSSEGHVSQPSVKKEVSTVLSSDNLLEDFCVYSQE